ncbi:MAG: hypothetical protein ACOYMB_02180 [Patescibacteria group bacterium]
MGRILYEMIRNMQSMDALLDCDYSKTLKTLLEKNIISNINCDSVPGLTIQDLNVPSEKTSRQPFSIFAIENNHMSVNLQLFLQMATEPNLFNNHFTQAQLVDLIENHQTAIHESFADEIFVMFSLKKEGVVMDLVAMINFMRNNSKCYIFDQNSNYLWYDSDHTRSVLIKTR